ncbi:MAG TPA: hypothetical protein DCR14_07745 [Acidimicrobiaceae bacterium]|nr:hypothetical protein [Acidimicrobiaceae bacterium]
MIAPRHTARPALRWLLALLAGGVAAACWGTPVHAVDNTLVASTPAADSTVDVAPSTISLQFANPLGDLNTLTMTCGAPDDAVANPIPLGTPIRLADGVTLTASVPSTVGKGVCTVAWKVADVNLQPAGSGSFSFTVANDPVATTAPTTSSTVAGEEGADTTAPTATTVAPTGGGTSSGGGTDTSEPTDLPPRGPLGLFRLLSILGLAALFGALVVITLAWPEGVEYLVTVRHLKLVWALALAAAVLYAGATAQQISGEGLGSALMPTSWGTLLDTTAGKAALLRVLFVAGSAYAAFRPERAIDPASQLPALGLPALAVATIAFSRDQFGIVEFAVGLAHALAMAAWLGGLVLMVSVVLSGPGDEDLVHATRGFGRLSVPLLLVTVVTGVAQMFRLDQGAIFTSSHGRVLVLKAVFVAAMVFVALESRRFIKQRASRAHTMSAPLAGRLRRALRFEMGIGVVVLALTAWLLALAPVGLANSGSSAYDLGTVRRFVNESLSADVRVTFSEKVGANDVRIEVVSPSTGLSGLQVDFVAPAGSTIGGLSIVDIPLTGAGTIVYTKSSGFALQAPGTWTVIVRIGTNEVARTNVMVEGDAPQA